MCFDQWMTFYQHYTVLGSKITVTLLPSGATVAEGCGYVAIIVTDDSTALNSLNTDTMLEQPNITHKMFKGYNSSINPTISKKLSVKKYFRRNPMADYYFAGTAASSPYEQAFYHVVIIPASAASNLSEINIRVKIEYIAVLTEPKYLSSS